MGALLTAWPVWAQTTEPAATEPATTEPAEQLPPADTQPSWTHPLLTREARTARLIEHLNREYGVLLKSRDWLNRSIALVCLARVPGEAATAAILNVYKQDQHEIVRMLAWHCAASRARAMTEAELDTFLTATHAHIQKNTFKGDMRAAVVNQLAANAPDKAAKLAWRKYFAEANFLAQGNGADDRELIQALGECLRRWRSAELVEFLIDRMGNINDAYRAERVLRIAANMDPAGGEPTVMPAIKFAPRGSEVAWRTAQSGYRDWLKKEKEHWVEAATTLAVRQSLSSSIIKTAELDPAKIDPNDQSWRADLELRSPDLRSLNVSFVIDATGSMQAGINWVKNELTRAMAAFALVSKEPRVGVTFYRDKNDEFIAQTSAMVGPTGIRNLIDWVGKMKAEGGGDMPEAVREGLTDSVQRNPWPPAKDARKIIILVADAPPHEATQAEVEKGVAALAKERRFRFYTVSLSSACHKELSAIAKAGMGENFDIAMDYSSMFGFAMGNNEGLPPAVYKEFAWTSRNAQKPVKAPVFGPRGAAEEHIETLPSAEGIRRLLTSVIIDAINPQYRDRVGPIVGVLISGLSGNAEPERRRHFVAFNPLPRRGPVRLPGEE